MDAHVTAETIETGQAVSQALDMLAGIGPEAILRARRYVHRRPLTAAACEKLLDCTPDELAMAHLAARLIESNRR